MAIHDVPLVSQPTEYLCWEACGRAMWLWHHHKKLIGYDKKGASWVTLQKGLTFQEMTSFYTALGLRELGGATGAKLRNALGWSPVVCCRGDRVQGHAMVVKGLAGDRYFIMDPSGKLEVVFDEAGGATASPTAAITKIPRVEFEKTLYPKIWYW